jgi:hypothetical protein
LEFRNHDERRNAEVRAGSEQLPPIETVKVGEELTSLEAGLLNLKYFYL